jgi:hypothetical protein
MGVSSDYSGFGLFCAGAARPNQLHVSCWKLDYPINFTFSNDTWHHVTYTYSGGGWSRNSSLNAYVDGIKYGFGDNWSTGTEGTTPTIATSNVPLRLGTVSTGGTFDGKIANFRLFNRALSSDEIYQLYAYQKEYFGHGTLGMTLKAGRLGIGTSEPRAALDVRGDIIGGCPAFFSATRTSGTVTSPATVVFNSIQVSKGGGFNTSTGGYTVPLSGYYFIGHHSASSTTAHYQPKLRVNDVDFNNYLSRNYSSGGSTNRPVSFSLIGYLNAGDTATIYITVGVMHSTYAGFTMYYLSS